ncbi:Protein of unknown function (DUF1676) [Nesidiocoris tenuis]|uniref:Osiris 9 n=1 Tax=Nesidiocoris tenuis TaxID=355587 RepID=A0ABN7AX44_9HEMI|nr:Protein of unknown function (DUF1676) [Nesidiocoris tenuis]
MCIEEKFLAIALVALSSGAFAAEESISSGMRVVYSAYRQCENSVDPVICLKARAVKLVDRALHSDAIPLVDGISLIKRPESERSLKEELEPLPTDLESRANKVDDLLWNRVGAFLQSHSVQLNMPSFVNEAVVESEDDEGRGKKKKLIPAILLGLLLKGSMLAMAMKALALLAAKALLVSKLALILAGIIALKKLFSSGGEKTTYEIVKQPIVSHSHEYSSSHEGGYEGGYGRSFDSSVAHRLAYRAYKQQQEQQQTDSAN